MRREKEEFHHMGEEFHHLEALVLQLPNSKSMYLCNETVH
jgi:hypothetical protein